MFTMVTGNERRVASAIAAVAVVAFAGLALDEGHLGGLPEGTVEVGELTPVDVMQMAAITLPEVVVTARRSEAGLRRPAGAVSALAAVPGRGAGDTAETSTLDVPGSGTVLLK